MCAKKEFEIRSTLFCNKVILPYLLEFWKCHLFIRKENINIQKDVFDKNNFWIFGMLLFEGSCNFYVIFWVLR